MQSIFSLETAQERDFKQGVKELLGKVIAIASPKRARTLYLNPASSPAKVSDRMIMSFLKRRAVNSCLLYTSPSPRDQRGSRMPSSA